MADAPTIQTAPFKPGNLVRRKDGRGPVMEVAEVYKGRVVATHPNPALEGGWIASVLEPEEIEKVGLDA